MAKFELQDFVQFGQLFETYGALLSDDRQKIMTAYFEFNETLAEIAQERNISRQAVLDSIEKSCEKLLAYENSLMLCSKRKTIVSKLAEIQQTVNSCSAALESFKDICLKNQNEAKMQNWKNLHDALDDASKKVENILKEI